MGRIGRALAHRHFAWLVAAVTALVYAPSLRLGLLLDDITLSQLLRGATPGVITADPRFELFKFVTSERDARVGMEAGFWPWWTSTDFRLAFMRPLSSLSHALDVVWLQVPPWFMHAENVALYVAIVLIVGALARRWLGGLGAGVATLAFALSDAHAMPVGWIANRNALFATLFGYAALLAYDHATRDGSRAGRVVGPLAFALGLASGEVATGTLAYLVAHALFLDARPRRARAWSLAPYGLVAAVWAVTYKALGYGAAAGAFYIDPTGQPGAYARAAVLRLPILLGAQLGPVPADVLASAEASVATRVALAGVVVVIALLVTFRALGRDPHVRFGAVSMVLALAPTCAVFPSDRSLLFSSLGAAILFGRVVAWSREQRRGRAQRVVTVALIGTHLVLAPLLIPARLFVLEHLVGAPIRRAAASFPTGSEGKSLVALGAPDPLVLAYITALGDTAGRAPPARIRLLAIVWRGTQTCRRVDARSLEMTLSAGFIQDPIGAMFRGENAPMHVGDVVEMSDVVAKVAETTPDGRPRRVVFTFAEPLESPRYAFIAWKGKGFSKIAPPAVGVSIELAPTPLTEAYAP